MPLYGWISAAEIRSKVITLPLLSIGTSEQAITWSTPMPDAAYAVTFGFELGAASVGGLSAGVKPGTLTAAGVTITLANTLLVSISAGAKLNVTATQLTE